jgi:hypothetical protein
VGRKYPQAKPGTFQPGYPIYNKHFRSVNESFHAPRTTELYDTSCKYVVSFTLFCSCRLKQHVSSFGKDHIKVFYGACFLSTDIQFDNTVIKWICIWLQVIFLTLLTFISWHVGPLLGNDREISKYTTDVTEYRLRKQTCSYGNN